MELLVGGFREARRLILSGDRELVHALYVNLVCTFSSVTLAALVAVPLGAWLGIHRRGGKA